MNFPSRPEEALARGDWNQNPPQFLPNVTTRQDINGLATSRLERDHQSRLAAAVNSSHSSLHDNAAKPVDNNGPDQGKADIELSDSGEPDKSKEESIKMRHDGSPLRDNKTVCSRFFKLVEDKYRRGQQMLLKFGKFIGPGLMISVAYIDPGNYSTDVAAGASFKFRLLFIILMANFFAVFLQSLCIKLGTVTGMNLAENCRAHLPRWLNFSLYILAEAAIIATDIAEVIGSAIALDVLLHIPLVAGCAITLVDVLIILLFYNGTGSMKRLRAFEYFVAALVLGVVVCFCIQLSLIKNTSVGEVFQGYLPSRYLIESNGIYQSCGILGATVMPHSLYLGSGIVQSRLREFDINAGVDVPEPSASDYDLPKYRPSLAAIRSCLSYSIVELTISLLSFALFVNSAILIVAGASLSSTPAAESADLFGIHSLLSQTIAPAAGTIFALALLLSGISAGIVATIAGQMVSEGAIHWTVAPWLRRLVTRAVSITPSIIIAAAVGKDGLSAALNGTQVALSVILPFVSAPLIYFTCRNRYMTVDAAIDTGAAHQEGENNAGSTSAGEEMRSSSESEEDEQRQSVRGVKMRNHPIIAILAVLIWLVIAIMNVALLVLLGMGKT
ncbi:MAG: hypothetical protein M1819_005595 [Sarea resinae]|nr:MAG: hypothetical protein M1819_005595 [Sarea resinae]